MAEVCQSFVLDNGAYTAWRNGRPLDVLGYYAWVGEWCRHPGFDWALIPDVIDGDEAANDALMARWPAEFRDLGVPVWHLHESLERLVRMASEWRVVALGSSGDYSHPGARAWWTRMDEAMHAVCDHDGRPRCKLHGLRMLSPRIFSRLPLASADSTNAARNSNHSARFGIYKPPTAAARAAVIADRIESAQSAPVFERLA